MGGQTCEGTLRVRDNRQFDVIAAWRFRPVDVDHDLARAAGEDFVYVNRFDRIEARSTARKKIGILLREKFAPRARPSPGAVRTADGRREEIQRLPGGERGDRELLGERKQVGIALASRTPCRRASPDVPTD